VRPVTSSTKNVITKPIGSAAGSCERQGSSNASTSSAKNATSQMTERRSPCRASAASGVKIAHRSSARCDEAAGGAGAGQAAGGTRGAAWRARSKSNNDLPRAQFVPNTTRNCGHSRVATVSPFLCTQGNRLARASSVSSSKLVARPDTSVSRL
jgi:hypothetical protein